MSVNDPIGDMLTRIRNGQRAHMPAIESPASKLRSNVLEVLQREGYIRGYSEAEQGAARTLRIELKYHEGEPVIKEIKRVSKPGRRVYAGRHRLPRVLGGQHGHRNRQLLHGHCHDQKTAADGSNWRGAGEVPMSRAKKYPVEEPYEPKGSRTVL